MKNFLLAGSCIILLSAVGTGLVSTGPVCAGAEPDVKVTVEVGKPAPDITLTGIDGNQFKLSDVTSSGKNVALMFSRAHW